MDDIFHEIYKIPISEITGNIILEKLGGLPEENEHCAFLAAESLQKALHDFMIKQTHQRDK